MNEFQEIVGKFKSAKTMGCARVKSEKSLFPSTWFERETGALDGIPDPKRIWGDKVWVRCSLSLNMTTLQ